MAEKKFAGAGAAFIAVGIAFTTNDNEMVGWAFIILGIVLMAKGMKKPV